MTVEKSIEQSCFPLPFLCLKYIGFWLPTTIKQRWLQICYILYTMFTAISISLVVCGPLADIIIAGDNFFIHFVESWHLIAVTTHIVIRGLNVMRNRKRIIRLLRKNIVVERWTNLRDDEEIQLIEISKSEEQNLLRLWMSLVGLNYIMSAFIPIISSNPDNYLIYKSWLPCDRHVPSCFWICWLYQCLSYGLGSITHVSCDCIVINFIQRICAHFRLLQHRLALLPDLVRKGVLNTAEKERLYVIDCILDHQNIYSATNEISQMFNGTTFLHFTLSFSILCTNIYFLSKQPLFSDSFIAVSFFLCCMLTQSLVNCWYGYELSQINNDISYTIFAMNWIELREETRKMLRFMMLSSSKSITLFNNFIVELSPEMFLKILKISYSAYNLLKTQNKIAI